MVASACEATPMAPAAVKTAIRHNDFEKAADFEKAPDFEKAAPIAKRALALSGSSFAVAIAVPSPSTRIIPDSQPLKLSVAEATSVHQRKASNSSAFAAERNKKASYSVKRSRVPVIRRRLANLPA
jgi:hypothetical protein